MRRRSNRISDVRELAALKREGTLLDTIVALIEVWILLILEEVGDQELTAMAKLCSSEPLYGT